MMKVSFASASLTAILLVTPALGASQIAVDDDTFPETFKEMMRKRLNLKSNEFQMMSVVPAEELREVVGKGYDIFEGKVLNEKPCVEENGGDHDTYKEGLEPSYSKEYSETVNGMSSNQSASGTSAGFDVTYKLLSLDFKSGSKSTEFFNSSDGFGRVLNRIVTRVQFRDGGKWSGAADTFLKNKDIEGFLKQCATHYIQAIYYGHLIDETLRFELREDKRTSSDSNSLSVGIKGLLNLGTSDESSKATVNKLSQVRYDSASRGVIAKRQPPPKDVDATAALVDFARYDFRNQVADADINKSSILLINVVPYHERTLPRLKRVPEWPDHLLGLMQQKTEMLYMLMTGISDINYAIRLNDKAVYDQLYASPAFDQLEDTRKAAEALRAAYKTAIDKCRELVKSETGTGAEKTCKDGLAPTLSLTDVRKVLLKRKS